MVNVTEVQRRWRSEFGIWCWRWTFWIFVTLNAKCYNSIYLYASYDHLDCVYILGHCAC
jgi:hypothetical protein